MTILNVTGTWEEFQDLDDPTGDGQRPSGDFEKAKAHVSPTIKFSLTKKSNRSSGPICVF